MRKSLPLSLAIAAIPVAAATVGPHIGELRGSLGIEAEWSVDGDFHGAVVSDIVDLGLLGPDYAGEAGQLDIRKASYDDTYEQPTYGARAELSYGVSDNVEVYGAFTWAQMGETQTVLGDIVVNSTGELIPLYASFGDYNVYGGELGARYYFDTTYNEFRPFLGASVGAQFVDSISMHMTAPGAGVDIADLGFYDSTTILTAGAEAGVAFGDGVNWSGSVSVGVKYASSLDGDTTDLDAYGIGAIAGSTEQITVPVKGSLSISF